jgi:O-antigen/teichoic acid export membrane protein
VVPPADDLKSATAAAEAPSGEPPRTAERHRPAPSLGLRATSNTVYLLGGAVLARLATLVLAGYLGRSFAAPGLGAYNLVVAITGLFQLIADFGVTQYLTRELAARPTEEARIMRLGAVGALYFGASAFLACNAIALAAGYPSRILQWILIASAPSLLAFAYTGIALPRAKLQGRKVAILTLAGQLSASLLIVVVVVSGQSIGTLIVLQAVTGALSGLLILGATRAWRFWRPPWGWRDLRAGLSIARNAAPLGVVAVLALIYYRLDTYILSLVKSEADVGYYSSAWKMSEALHLLPTAVAATMLSVASRRGARAREQTAQALTTALRYLVLAGLPVIVGSVLLAPSIVRAVYGPSLLPAAPTLRVMLGAELASFFGVAAAAALTGLGRVRLLFKLQLVTIPLNGLACLLLLPRYGYQGAAWISLVTEIVSTGGLVYLASRELRAPHPLVPWGPVGRVTAACLPMAMVVVVLHEALHVPLAAVIAAAAFVFTTAAVAVGALRRQDVQLVARSLRTPSVEEPVLLVEP